jgi:hypothetical protein
MARGSGFGALGKNFIIVGNAQHRIFGLKFGYLICATTSFFCALTPVLRSLRKDLGSIFLPRYKVRYSSHKIISHSQPAGV